MILISVQPFNFVKFYVPQPVFSSPSAGEMAKSLSYYPPEIPCRFAENDFSMLFPSKPVYGQVFRSKRTHQKPLPDPLTACILKSLWYPL